MKFIDAWRSPAWLQQIVQRRAQCTMPMMEGATLLLLPKPLLEKVFSYNFPINMLRAVACCQQLHTALGEKLKTSTHFATADWVILGEIDKPGFNGRVGQITKLRLQDRTRYAVQVDGLSEWGPFQVGTMPTLEEGIGRPFSLSRFKLQKIPTTVCAVRLPTQLDECFSLYPSDSFVQRGFNFEYVRPSDSVSFTCKHDRHYGQTLTVSAARIPCQLAIFSNPDGQSPTMEALGRPVVLRQVISAHAALDDVSHCQASGVLRGDENQNCEWSLTSAGPTIIAWQDQSDFTLDDMKQVWQFHHAAHLHMMMELPNLKDKLVRLWKEAAEVNNTSTQEVVHEEPPAEISPDEAQRLVEAQLASTIQSEPMPSTMGELACVVTFHRTPRSLDRAVSQSDSGRRLLEKGVNLKPCWANGAKILVEGLTEDIWKHACRDAGANPELRPAHVVLPSGALSEILAEVQKIPHSSRPRIKAGQATISVPDLSMFGDLSDTGARGSQESSYALISSNSSTVHSETSGWAAFIDGLREEIMHIPLGPLNVRHGFIHEPEETPITPRSVATIWAGQLGNQPALVPVICF